MIRGYPARASVRRGERLVLHVATGAPRFRVRFLRAGDGFQCVHESDWLPGTDAPERGADADFAWPAYGFDVLPAWPPGAYVAHLEEPGGAAFDVAQDSAAALFVVRGERRSGLLYKLPLATYHAYNVTGGGCFYHDPPRSHEPPGSRVSLRRPGGGIGGETFGALDHYDRSSARQTFAHWDARFIAWLARNGYDADFCTDFDVHDDPDVLRGYRLLLSVGHDEYWSDAMRDAVEAFARDGGNVAFFGANLCWWRIHVVDDGAAIVCHQGGPHGALDHWWPPTGAHRPEDALTGVSYRHGGGWWDGPRDRCGFVVQRPDHAAFAGTGLRLGDAFGADTTPPLAGYECDGAPLEFDSTTGVARLAPEAHARYGTPAGFVPLAVARLGDGWQELPPRETHAARAGVHSATMGTFGTSGTTFVAGTVDWAQVLASGDRIVDRITRNVLDLLLRPHDDAPAPSFE